MRVYKPSIRIAGLYKTTMREKAGVSFEINYNGEKKVQLFQGSGRNLAIFLLFCISFTVTGQQFPQFSQNMFNHLATNPGYAGNSGMINVALGNRQQWMGGFDGMAPKTTVFGADANFNILGWDSGVGLSMMNDEIGVFTNLYMSLDYAKRWETDYGKLGVGLSFGIVNQTINGSELETDPTQSDYGVVYGDDIGNSDYHDVEEFTDDQGTAFDLGFGAFLDNKDYYLGISVAHLNKPKPKFVDTYEMYFNPTVFITGGYRFKNKEKPLVLIPSVFFKYNLSSYQVDLNMNGIYKERYWGGLTVRLQDAIVLLGGVELNNGLRIGYSYDINITQMSEANNGSHEIMFGYSFDMSLEKRKKQYKSVRFL